MHAGTFEAPLHHEFVGAFHHPRANGPALLAIARILHERFAFVQVGAVFAHRFQFGILRRQMVQEPQEGSRAAMLEDMQTPRLAPARRDPSLRPYLSPHLDWIILTASSLLGYPFAKF